MNYSEDLFCQESNLVGRAYVVALIGYRGQGVALFYQSIDFIVYKTLRFVMLSCSLALASGVSSHLLSL